MIETLWRHLSPAVPITALTLLAAGCGSANAPSVAAGGSFVPFVKCMTAHGVTASTGPA